MNAESKCPMGSKASRTAIVRGMTNLMWWPDRLDLSILNQNSPLIDPLGPDFDYAAAFAALDLKAVKADIIALMTESQPWWPADWGHYGPLFVRMAWHSAGTYRISDGRGGAGSGTQRFAPLNAWPDNVNLDKARLLLWPVKQKYGRALSWADLLILAGNCALESMGLETVGFGGGRADVWQPETDIYWGPEGAWLADERYSGDRDLADPLGAVQMGLIYVNPEGPNGNPDPVAAAHDIRETFARMAMNDEETVALIAGGHTFGKCHGAGDAAHVGADPEAAPIEALGLGWASTFQSGVGADAISSGLEVIWTQTPTRWSNHFFRNLFENEWVLTKSPAGAHQWEAKDAAADIPDPFVPGRFRKPTMLTTDLSLRMDPAYEKISRRFHENPDQFAKAFAEAWYKLTHRDMGPIGRYVGPEVPAQPRLWQDPVPPVDHPLVTDADVAQLKADILASGLGVSQLVKAAWASASTFRGSDKRGGANGARVRLAPQKDWAVNEPAELALTLDGLERVRTAFNAAAPGGRKISLADMIVLGGAAAIEEAARRGGQTVTVPFKAGRTDATAAQTDAASFAVLEPKVDAFRNFGTPTDGRSLEEMMVDRAQLLTLTAPEMTALLGGLRVLGANHGEVAHGCFTDRVGTLSNDFFVNLLGSSFTHSWAPAGDGSYVATDRRTGARGWTATRVDLVFASNAELRAVAETYAASDGAGHFAQAFVAAWTKVMEADRI